MDGPTAGALFLAAAGGACGALGARARARAREGDLRVTSLHVHPVKGARGHAVAAAHLDAHGMAWDRRWMVVRGPERLFTTQRQVPAMATLEAGVLLPPALAHLACPPAAVVEPGVARVTLRLAATRGPAAGSELRVPVVTAADVTPGAGGAPPPPGACVVEQLTVWGTPVAGAVDQGDAAAAWLTAALADSPGALPPWNVPGQEATAEPLLPGAPAGAGGGPVPLRLVYFDPRATTRALSTSRRPPGAPPRYATQVGFADGYPLLVASEQSLGDLNARLPPGEGPLPMARFRPNVVVDAPAPWAEDRWRRFVVRPPRGDPAGRPSAGVTCHGVKRCGRCKVPTIDQLTGEPHPSVLRPEPLATMRAFRGDAARSGEVYFGQNVVCEVGAPAGWGGAEADAPGAPAPFATIAVGDVVTLLDVGRVEPV